MEDDKLYKELVAGITEAIESKKTGKHWALHCEYETRLNGNPSSVIMVLICNSKLEAESLSKEREGVYTNHKIKEVKL